MAGPSTAPSDAAEDRVGRSFLALGAGEAAARAIAFAAAIVLARRLGVEGYGVVGVATALLLYLNRVADWGMDLGVGVRLVAAGPASLERLASTLLTARVLLALVLAATVAVAAPLLLPQPEASVFALFALTLPAFALSPRWVLLGLQRPRAVAIARAAGELAGVVAVLTLVRSPEHLLRVPLVQLGVDVAIAAALLAAVRAGGLHLRPMLDRAVLRAAAGPGGRMVASTLLGLLMYNADWILLRAFHGAAAVGQYVAAYALVSLFLNLGVAYRLSLLPALGDGRQTAAALRARYQASLAQVFTVVLPVTVGGSLVAPALVTAVFGESYAPAGHALRLLVWSLPLALLREVPVVVLLARGREDRVLRMTGWGALVTVGLGLLAVPRWGMTGAAAVTIASEAVRLGTAVAMARGEGFAFVPATRLWRAALAVGIMAALLLALDGLPVWIAIPLGALAYAGVLALVGGLRLRRDGLPALTV